VNCFRFNKQKVKHLDKQVVPFSKPSIESLSIIAIWQNS
jgi:hypothetical protein